MSQSLFSAKFPPRKPKNENRRSREYLTANEVDVLIKAARHSGRNGHRDATLILISYRHALRVSEVSALRWDQVDLKLALLHVHRMKNGVPSVQPLHGSELRALRQLHRESTGLPYVFNSERGSPLSERTIRNMVLRAGEEAKLPFPIHPHMLRHACGFYLANKGIDTRAIQHYLGHRNIQHTVRYTEISAQRFVEFWDD